MYNSDGIDLNTFRFNSPVDRIFRTFAPFGVPSAPGYIAPGKISFIFAVAAERPVNSYPFPSYVYIYIVTVVRNSSRTVEFIFDGDSFRLRPANVHGPFFDHNRTVVDKVFNARSFIYV